MTEHIGWLLDLYPDPQGGLVLWLLADDGEPGCTRQQQHPKRQCYRLWQDFPVTFYVAGPTERLRALWKFLQAQEVEVTLSRTERRDLFLPQLVIVLAVQVAKAIHQPALFAQAARAFPDLTYYDADLAITLRHAAIYGTFPLCKMLVVVDDRERVQSIRVLDSPWELDPLPAPLRVMTIQPDCDPRHETPQSIQIRFDRYSCRLLLSPWRPLLINLSSILKRQDPDLLLTDWGDTWLLPYLLDLCEQHEFTLPLNRDERMDVTHKRERSYQAYGQVIHRGRQVLLFGRWHIDRFNAMMFHDYGMDGILESARVTGLPVQQTARISPGTGISAMQIVTALRQGILVPWHKQQAEMSKTALDLLHADQGGLVYQPTIGLHTDVAEIDFVSMYPSIMARFNVSPETIATPNQHSAIHNQQFSWVPELNLQIDQSAPGLIPQTLKPLLEKRIAFKQRIPELPDWDPRKQVYKARAAAHKWLLVTCFGYLGYKNARFGRIEAHQAVTAYSRECLLRAKEAAEDAGFRVLHLYVDGLWVQKEAGKSLTVQDVQPLLDEIATRTGLPIALDGIYRWVAFLPSRMDIRVPVASRYFGVFQDRSIKVRGIEARRHDTPPFIAQTQMALLEYLAKSPNTRQLSECLPNLIVLLRQQIRLLRTGCVPLPDLLVTQKLSRELSQYRTPSPAARAAIQLQAVGKPVRPGQPIKLLYTLGEPGVHAWDCPPAPSPAQLDTGIYMKLMLRAAEAVIQPFGVSSEQLSTWVLDKARYLPEGKYPLFQKPGSPESGLYQNQFLAPP